jgi:hypothetical protein
MLTEREAYAAAGRAKFPTYKLTLTLTKWNAYAAAHQSRIPNF